MKADMLVSLNRHYGNVETNTLLEKSDAFVLGNTGDTEIEQYLKEPLILFHRVNSYLWWRKNRHCFV